MPQKKITLLSDNFMSFSIGPFPFDREHSAMGEYHYSPTRGYKGQWYDPIANCNYRGPSWMVTSEDGVHYMEQTRVRNPLTHGVCPALAAGDVHWHDYEAAVSMQPLCTKEEAGILFRYQTSLMYYAFYLNNQQAQFWKVEKKERKLLQSVPFRYDCDHVYQLSVQCRKDTFLCSVNGKPLIRVQDSRYANGKIAISAFMPARFTGVQVSAAEEEYHAYLTQKEAREKRLAEKRLSCPQPLLYKIIDLKNFGAARQIRFGHLTGGSEMYFVMAQHQKRVFKERYCNISCLTAVNMVTGKVLWQLGEPSELRVNQDTTCDLPFQVYDINEDGCDEVIVAKDFKLMILDGRTGETLQYINTPENVEPADEICGIEFQKHAFDRLNVDAIRIVNVSGNRHPSDILIKDRYARLWVYNSRLELLWKFSHNNTGHFPFSYDFNHDGKDEIFSCYNMISSDGKLLWELPIPDDHTDEIIVGKFDPDEKEMLAIVSGWEGFMLVDTDGKIRARDINGHAQRISAANYRPQERGLEICTTTYWENQNIVYLYDCKGRELWHMEQQGNGNIIAPVNWKGDGSELILLNGSTQDGGMIDGDGDRVAVFPDDGHPDLCAEVINLTGDARDEIVLWDANKMYIYTQDRPCPVKGKEYVPLKYPRYNSSNYRGEYSFARWE
jgi:hypothetical protein